MAGKALQLGAQAPQVVILSSCSIYIYIYIYTSQAANAEVQTPSTSTGLLVLQGKDP